jgi:hypothetical protein
MSRTVSKAVLLCHAELEEMVKFASYVSDGNPSVPDRK